jgi:hypothetical protein
VAGLNKRSDPGKYLLPSRDLFQFPDDEADNAWIFHSISTLLMLRHNSTRAMPSGSGGVEAPRLAPTPAAPELRRNIGSFEQGRGGPLTPRETSSRSSLFFEDYNKQTTNAGAFESIAFESSEDLQSSETDDDLPYARSRPIPIAGQSDNAQGLLYSSPPRRSNPLPSRSMLVSGSSAVQRRRRRGHHSQRDSTSPASFPRHQSQFPHNRGTGIQSEPDDLGECEIGDAFAELLDAVSRLVFISMFILILSLMRVK